MISPSGVAIASGDEAEVDGEAEGAALPLDAAGDELGPAVRPDEVDDLLDDLPAVPLPWCSWPMSSFQRKNGPSVCGGSGTKSHAT